MLYQALTGKVPYPRETAAATMLAHLDSPPPSVLSVLPDASERLGGVVRRAMAKEPGARFPSAGDLGRAILAAADERQLAGPERSVATGAAAGTAAPAVSLPPALESVRGAFVGRADALAKIDARYATAETGQRQFVLLVGEPGIGKTRLATEFARRVHAEGATVLFGRSDPESLIPYQPFVSALRHLGHELNPGDEQDRWRLFEGVVRHLTFAAAQRPVVLIVDDLHWADTGTTQLLAHLLDDAAPRLLVIATARAADLGELLGRLRRQPSFEQITLTGLSADETRAMVGADVSSQFVRRLTDETEGNPFFIEETLRSLPELEERALSRIAVPDGVKEMLSRRLPGLSERPTRC